MKKKHYIIIAVASYFLFLITTVPAKPVTELINDNTPINIQGVSGTLWEGNAYVISINPNTIIKNTHWSFSVWKVFIGQLAADISTEYQNNKIKTEIGVSLFGNYFVNDLTANIAAKDIVELANIPLAQFSGSIAVNIEHAQWSQGELPLATGVLRWSNATVSVADTVALGNIQILLSESEEGLLLADIDNKGGDITIVGIAQLVPEANYKVDIKLTPTASANSNIAQSLSFFATKQNNGDYRFKSTGPLDQIGLM